MAKLLYLVRHAKSSWADMGQRDFDRPLNKRGLRDAPEMGRRLKARSTAPDIILCSPAMRTRRTAELLLTEIGRSVNDVRLDDRLYEATFETLLDLIQSLPEDCSSAMIIGHNPSMGWMVDQRSDGGIDRMPTCAVATLQFETDEWQDIGTRPGHLLDFDFPKRDQSSGERF